MHDLIAQNSRRSLLILMVICQSTIFINAQQRTAEPERIPLGQSQEFKCRIGRTFYSRQLYLNFGFRSNAEAQDTVEEVIRAAGLLPGVVVARAAEVGNAEACRGSDGNDYILFNPGWLSNLYKDADEYWANRAIIAHELGHIVLNHVLIALGSNPKIELQADEYAGTILAKLGASRDQAIAAYKSGQMKTPHDSTRYPSTDQRLAAVEKGLGGNTRRESDANPTASHLVRTANGWKPEAGYTWLTNDARDLRVRWQPGAPYPLKSHVSACVEEGKWCAEAGYVWIDLKRPWPSTLDVRWSAGLQHPSSQNVKSCPQEGYWCADPGWSWVNPANPSASNFAVSWLPGLPISGYRHVVACPMEYKGQWCPELGYAWINAANPSASDYAVRWAPGSSISGYKNVVACATDGMWCPAAGYNWANLSSPSASNYAVRWVPGSVHPSAPHVIASETEGSWAVEAGYTWVNPADNSDLRVRPINPG